MNMLIKNIIIPGRLFLRASGHLCSRYIRTKILQICKEDFKKRKKLGSTRLCDGRPLFWRYGDTLKVPMSLFRDNRERLISRLRAKCESAMGTFVVLQGGVDVPFNDTDVNWPFRQIRFD
ncbi:hypothetical protein P5V15_002437 [Pogonomyrmex californicus]